MVFEFFDFEEFSEITPTANYTHNMVGGVLRRIKENAKEMKPGNLGGWFQVEKTPEWGGEQEVLLKYGVRSLHCASNRRARVGGKYF